jgi:hypothetical protein
VGGREFHAAEHHLGDAAGAHRHADDLSARIADDAYTQASALEMVDVAREEFDRIGPEAL